VSWLIFLAGYSDFPHLCATAGSYDTQTGCWKGILFNSLLAEVGAPESSNVDAWTGSRGRGNRYHPLHPSTS